MNMKKLEIFKDFPDIDIRSASRRSFSWYTKVVAALSKKPSITRNPNRIISKGDPSTVKVKAVQGFMYLFGYDAKYKETLPIWDRYPLVIPFGVDKEGFIGFNIHYLPYRERCIMLERILYFANNQRMDNTTKVRLSWNLVQSWSKIEALQYCVKRYRWDHVKTPFKHIEPSDWGLVALMPLHKFVGGNVNTAWKLARRGR